jgi:hypothetical protein
MAWTAPKIALLLSSKPALAGKPWKPVTAGKTVNTSPRQLSSMEKTGISRG